MTCSVSHWSGRLGNNIQQVANCIMRAELTGDAFYQKLSHEIIKKFVLNFGREESSEEYEGRFYSWEPLVHCEKGIFEGGNEIGVDKDYVYQNIRRVCRNYIIHHLDIVEKDVIGDDTVVMHLRSGDNYHRVFDPPTNYIPNPLIYYLNLIDSFDKCILVTEPDRENPIVHELMKIDIDTELPAKFIVDSAAEADKKSYPIRWLIVVMSTFASVVFGLFVILFLDYWNTLKSAGQV